MAAHGARRLARMNENLAGIIGIEAICAAQGIEFRAPLRTSVPLIDVLARFRARVPAIRQDRYLAPDLGTAASLAADGTLTEGLALPEMAG